MKKILLTGGAGYIGIHTALSLLEKNFNVIIFDSLANSSINSISNLKKLFRNIYPDRIFNLEFVKGDVRDYKKLSNVFSENLKYGNSIDGIIHFAGLKSVFESFNLALDYWDVNVNGTLNLVKVMNLFNCRKLVFSSSASVYGVGTSKKLNEGDDLNPTSPYAYTKASIESLLENLCNIKGESWHIASLRYFNPIGNHYSGFIGENYLDKPTNLFPIINKVALGDLDVLKIFGNDWPTEDGTCIRDYVHIMDLADGHSLVLEYLTKNMPEKLITLNIGTGKATSVLELINHFQEVNKVEVPYIFSERRTGDSPYVVADNSKAKKLLNWEPKRDISSMCVDGWRWQKLNLKINK